MTYPPKELKLTEPTIPSVGEDEEQLKRCWEWYKQFGKQIGSIY